MLSGIPSSFPADLYRPSSTNTRIHRVQGSDIVDIPATVDEWSSTAYDP